MKTKQIKMLLNNGSQQIIHLTFGKEDVRTYVMTTDYGPLSRNRYQDSDFFECLKKLRLDGEKLGIKLLCNGARKDTYPSSMSRDMSGGRLVFILFPDKIADMKDLVFIFDEAPEEIIATVEEQYNYWQDWLKSKKGDSGI